MFARLCLREILIFLGPVVAPEPTKIGGFAKIRDFTRREPGGNRVYPISPRCCASPKVITNMATQSRSGSRAKESGRADMSTQERHGHRRRQGKGSRQKRHENVAESDDERRMGIVHGGHMGKLERLRRCRGVHPLERRGRRSKIHATASKVGKNNSCPPVKSEGAKFLPPPCDYLGGCLRTCMRSPCGK